MPEDLYCGDCDKHFQTLHGLKMHQQNAARHKKEQEMVQCHVCSRKFSDQAALDMHIESTGGHQDDGFYCRKCDRGFRNKQAYDQHVQNAVVHQERSESPSSECEGGDGDDREQLACHKCGRKFGARHSLEQHQRMTGHDKNDDRKEEEYHKCNHCGKQFESQRSLEQHLASTGHDYSCDECGKLFKEWRSLRQHEEATGHDSGQRGLSGEQVEFLRKFAEIAKVLEAANIPLPFNNGREKECLAMEKKKEEEEERRREAELKIQEESARRTHIVVSQWCLPNANVEEAEVEAEEKVDRAISPKSSVEVTPQ